MLDLTGLDTAELSSLTRAMHEARFPSKWGDSIVWLSPFVIDLHVAAIEEQRRRKAERNDERWLANFEAWLRWRGGDMKKIFVAHLAADRDFREQVMREGAACVRWALRPFVLDDAAVDDLIVEARRAEAANTTSHES